MSQKIRFPRVFLLLAGLSAASLTLRADSVTLTTGEKITGIIRSETDTEVTMDVPVSASITDQRVIKKEDIAKLEKDQPDDIAYKQLVLIQPNAEVSYPSDTYSQILAPLQAFETNYPKSAHLAEIQKLVVTFQDEKKRVDAGQVKYMGRWLSAMESAQPAIESQISALGVFNSMKQHAAADDLVAAMRDFDTIEKQYPGTRVYPQSAVLAQEIMPKLQLQLGGRMQEVKIDQDRLQRTIDFTAEPEKTTIINAARMEKDRADAAVNTAVKSGVKWVPLIPRSETSIVALQKTADSEAGRIEGLPVAAMIQSVKKTDLAESAEASGDYKTADALAKAASTLWSQNLAARSLGDRLRTELATMPTPTPKPTPASTPRPLPTVAHPAQVTVSANAAPAVMAEPDKPFFMTVPGAISIAAAVLILGGTIASYNKKKARTQATAE